MDVRSSALPHSYLWAGPDGAWSCVRLTGTSILDPPTTTCGFRGPGGRSIPTRSAAARGVCLSTSPDKFRFEGRKFPRPPRAEPEWE